MEAVQIEAPPRARRGPHVLVASICVGLGAAVAAMWLTRPDGGPQPVIETSLENSRVGRLANGHALRDLPFNLDMPERVDIAICLRLAGRVRNSGESEPAFTDEDTRIKLEDVLKRRPGFFYAEYLLGLWHTASGDPVTGARHYADALEHAPAVLVQRYELAAGQPLVGATIATFQVECNRVRHGKHDPSLKLTFFDLETDKDGCIRLPVYDTVYRLFNTSDPAGYRATYSELGWFEARGRVGLLPVATVRPERVR
jgi:hypothetical protein